MVRDSLVIVWAVALVVLLPTYPAIADPTPIPLPDGTGAPAEADAGTAADTDTSADAALKRVLASGCRDGLADVYALAGNPSAPWAETVLRLCGEVLRRAPRPRPRPQVVDAPEPATVLPRDATRDGRGQLVFWSGLYGSWLGVATDLLFDIDSGRGVILPPMLGMGAGLAVSLALTSKVHVTSGEAWTIITGLDYGSFNGALWAGGLGAGRKGIVGTSVASSIGATAVGLAVADASAPSAGQIELCRSGLLWGTVAGFLGVIAFAPDPGPTGQTTALGTAIAMDVGFIAGLGAARRFELSRSRVLIIDAGALGGTILGLGTVWLATGQAANHGHLLAGGALTGLLGGIVIAAVATQNLDASGETVAGGTDTFPALVTRDRAGRWHGGTPAPLPILDPAGVRLVGASLNAVGGLF
jgi:hypothetical protein